MNFAENLFGRFFIQPQAVERQPLQVEVIPLLPQEEVKSPTYDVPWADAVMLKYAKMTPEDLSQLTKEQGHEWDLAKAIKRSSAHGAQPKVSLPPAPSTRNIGEESAFLRHMPRQGSKAGAKEPGRSLVDPTLR